MKIYGSQRKPEEPSGEFKFPTDRFITPNPSAGLSAYLQQLKDSEVSQPAFAGGKTYSLVELAEGVQPAVPMINVIHVVRCMADHTVLNPATKMPETQRHVFNELELGTTGSGFFIDANGHVVTNCHVAGPLEISKIHQAICSRLGEENRNAVQFANKPTLVSLKVTLAIQGKHRVFAKTLPAVSPAEAQLAFELPADVVGYDANSDLAVLKVNGCTFPFLRFADPDGMKVGQAVTSIGYPKGDAVPGPASVSDGIISGLNRSPLDGSAADSVQHSATINNGNSGGPLLNRSGQVVGVNTYGFADQSVQNINFSRSPRTAAPFVEQIIRLGTMVRPETGLRVVVEDFRKGQASRDANLTYSTALIVNSTDPGSDVETLDIILQVNGRSVTNVAEWMDALALLEKTRPASVKLTIKRAPDHIKTAAFKKQIDAIVLARAMWEAKETEITIPLKWPN